VQNGKWFLTYNFYIAKREKGSRKRLDRTKLNESFGSSFMSVVLVVQHETKQGDGQNNIATTEICAL
jgi:hypothetical protein